MQSAGILQTFQLMVAVLDSQMGEKCHDTVLEFGLKIIGLSFV